MSSPEMLEEDPAEWWPKLSASTREWLIANNGDSVPGAVVNDIEAVAGSGASGAGWIGETSPDGVYLSDRLSEWIEETANHEH